MKTSLFLMLLLSGVFNLFAQESILYGIERVFSTQYDYLVRIDPEQGTITRVSSSSVGKSTTGNAAINPISNRYFFSEGNNFIGVDLKTGKKVFSKKNPTSGNNVNLFAFNYADQRLYGIQRVYNTQDDFLVKIKPWEGNYTKVATSKVGNKTAGNSAIDPINNLFFFSEGSNIVTVDINTGKVLYRKPNPISNSTVNLFAYSILEASLYGILRYHSSQDDYLVKIDPVNGKVTKISKQAIGRYTVGSSAIDQLNSQFVFSDNDEIIFVDISTGERIKSIKYGKNSRSVNLFAFDYELSYPILTSNSHLTLNDNDAIYPNPTNGTINVNGNYSLIRLFDLTGKEIFVDKLSSSDKPIELLNIPNGVYIYSLVSTNRAETKQGKLVIHK